MVVRVGVGGRREAHISRGDSSQRICNDDSKGTRARTNKSSVIRQRGNASAAGRKEGRVIKLWRRANLDDKDAVCRAARKQRWG